MEKRSLRRVARTGGGRSRRRRGRRAGEDGRPIIGVRGRCGWGFHGASGQAHCPLVSIRTRTLERPGTTRL